MIALLGCCTLSACGGGGGVNSTPPAPTPAPTPTPTPTPTPAPTPAPGTTNYDTAEYRRSNGAAYHGAIAAYQAGASGAGVTVGIVDSGIYSGSGEFAGRISPASRDFAGNNSIQDVDGHGTAVTTVLAAARDDNFIMGVAWNATILTLRADTPGSCATANPNDPASGCTFNDSAITSALDYARTNGAKVVNLSLGGADPAPATLQAAIGRAVAAGMIVIVSAGNESAAAPDAFALSLLAADGGHGQVIIAASVNADSTHSSFSNGAQGAEQATLSALGNQLLTQDNNGVHYLYSGTSFSAPMVSGAAALLAQAFPNLTAKQIVDLLLGTATDAGATGADAVFGRGILNIAAAFAPQGTLKLAGAAAPVPVSTASNASLSTPMGDAGRARVSAVTLDRYDRAYRLSIGQTLIPDRPSLMLAPALQGRQRNMVAAGGATQLALSIMPGVDGPAMTQPLMLSGRGAAQARLLSGMVASRIGQGTRFALGFSQGSGTLDARVRGAHEPAFLIAAGPESGAGLRMGADTSILLRQDIGGGVALTASAERGYGWMRSPGEQPWMRGDARHPYASAGIGADRQVGRAALALRATWMREGETVLGARFSPLFGAGAGRSLFVDGDAHVDAGGGWRFGGAWRQGWTWVSGGVSGAASGGSLLRTGGWALDAEKSGLVSRGDSLALRVSQPLRVAAGGLNLWLPDSYDYRTLTAAYSAQRLDLSPDGREVDVEAVYGRGNVTANAYWRREPGNIAWYPDDIGGAVRVSFGF